MALTIAVVGSINTDLVFKTPHMPKVGETVGAHEFRQMAGGKGANQAVASARQGSLTALIACVGADDHGRIALANLRADNISTDFISEIPGVATGVAGILVDDHGHNSIVHAPGANAYLTRELVYAAADAISQARVLLCQCEVPLPAVMAAIDLAAKNDVKVIFNPAPALSLPEDLLAQVDYLIVNEIESSQLTGIAVRDIASAKSACGNLLARGASCVLLTLGARGVVVALKNSTNYFHAPAVSVDAVDTTAAGDTFIGIFGSAIARDLSILPAINEAQHGAALAVTKFGAQSAIPNRRELISYMSAAGP